MKTKNVDPRYSAVGSRQRTDPYAMAFVYPLEGEPILIKGGLIKVKAELETIQGPFCWFKTLFNNGKSRSIGPYFENMPDGTACYPSFTKREKTLRFFKDGSETFKKTFRRFPRCFPVEIKNLIK